MWNIILGIVLVVAVAAIGYYILTIAKFKKFLRFEAELKANPSDEKVQAYMKLYEHTYIPNQPHIKATRSAVYRVVKNSDQVSYETKKALRHFFEQKDISVLTTIKQDTKENSEA